MTKIDDPSRMITKQKRATTQEVGVLDCFLVEGPKRIKTEVIENSK